MTTLSDKDPLDIRKVLAEIDKTREESLKAREETSKIIMDTRYTEKKLKWYEFTLVLALIGTAVALTKIFL